MISEKQEMYTRNIAEGMSQGSSERDFEHRLTDVTARAKANQRRIEKLEKRQADLDELIGVVKVLADREERVEGVVGEIKKDVKSLADKPGRRWDRLFEAVLTVIVGAVVGFILARIGF